MGERLAALEDLVVTSGDALDGRRVLVTGHTGFKGSWLTIWLRMIGARVAGFALEPPTTPNMFDATGVGSGILDRRGDIRDADAVAEIITAFEPEVVFHLAAQAIVRDSYRDPVGTYATNVVGTATLLDACRRAPSVRAIIVVSSDKCYENRNWPWGYRENDRLGGFDPYSNSKACTELVCEAFRHSFFHGDSRQIQLATARAGNVIGGGDWARDRLVPDLARAFASGELAMIRNPKAVRPWQHVLEPLAGYLELAGRLCSDSSSCAESWNFGPSPNLVRSVEAVVKELSKCWNGGLKWSLDEAQHPHEAARLLLDSSKAASVLGWRARLTFEDAIRFTADWYAAARRPEADLRQFTERQIREFVEKESSC